jgi:hypothetical protein
MSEPLLNLTAYTPLEIALVAIGGAWWVLFYSLVIVNTYRHKFVGMPIFALGGFIAWEILYGWVIRPDVGLIYVIGMKVYLPMSGFVAWLTTRHGHDQLFSSLMRKTLTPTLLFSIAAWTVLLYYYIPLFDDGAGMTTAHILIIITSSTFIPMALNLYEREGPEGLRKLSALGGWSKMLGNIFMMGFSFTHLPERRWVHIMGMIALCLDVTYLVLLYRLRAPARAAQPVPAAAPIGSAS